MLLIFVLVYEIVAKIKTNLDLWVTFLTKHDLLKENKLPPDLAKPELEKAIKVIEVMSFNDEERPLYEDRLKWLSIEANTLKKAENTGIRERLNRRYGEKEPRNSYTFTRIESG